MIGRRRHPHAAANRSGDRYFGSVDSRSIAEVHDYITVKDVALRIESQRWIGSKISSVRALGRRQRQIYTAPTAAAVRRVVSTHRQAKNFIGARCQRLWFVRINRDKGLALRSAFVRNIHVTA